MDFLEAVVDQDSSGMRLDRFLKKQFNLTHSIICKLSREKKILINNKTVKEFSNIISVFDNIIVRHNIVAKQPKIKENFVNPKIVEQIKKAIQYEDENIAIIDKPSGLATQSGGSLKYSLDDITQIIWPGQAKIVHRLDKDTSGLIIIAKNRITAQKIAKMFQENQIKKEYLAVVSPIPKKSTDTIQTYISEAKTQGKMHKCQNSTEGKIAITEYEIIKVDQEKNLALIKFMPKTGRTHQIRLHAQFINSPIIGDYKYHGNCNITKTLHLLAYSILVPEITPNKQIYATIPNFFIIKP